MASHPTSPPSSALAQLQNPSQPLTLLSLSETLHPKDAQPPSASKRQSNASESSEPTADTNPAALEADLTHYKDLFSKLRFSYVEQSTKEKFLRSITDNPPALIDPQENTVKEKEILEAKAGLKQAKADIAALLEELGVKGRELSARYEGVQNRTKELERIPAEIEELQRRIAELSKEQEPKNNNPELALPLPETEALLRERQAEIEKLDAQLAHLQTEVPLKKGVLEKLERELRPLEVQKQGTVAAAKEARRRKEEGGGIGDELEERGRWLRASEKALKEMLEVEN
ncbi:hypothetical protein GQ43DRAFT_406465 [Delitschia confertaspora ATCC 74209]|uniref:Kinetochore protein Sos7 coiled-coil domain-containing protein n=1 Tax=Delitschia confertaspora ATCC 74209 TaxID=1513339 RepID=A0A9P4JWR8_9PLEO|nr:hypothetical protein GQ43DRAFT_406465 [Delitschia confertaspora ATCC 74209]